MTGESGEGEDGRYEYLVGAAVEACLDAGEYLRGCFRRGVAARRKHGDFAVPNGLADVVSECDLRAEEMIRDKLRRADPHVRIVGEEVGEDGHGAVCWYIDPIDGTYNFLRGLPWYCVSIGLSVRGEFSGGCVYDPSHRELFTAVNGKLSLNRRPYTPAARPVGAPPLVLTDIPHGARPSPGDRELLLEISRQAEVRRVGSTALALAWLSVGRADAVANTDIFMWDVAAGRCLVEAAGGGFVLMPEAVDGTARCSFVAWTAGADHIGPSLVNAIAALSTPDSPHPMGPRWS